MEIKIEKLMAKDNYMNAFLADGHKIGDLVIATIREDGREISGWGETASEAIEHLKHKVKEHYAAKAAAVILEISVASGEIYIDV